MTFKRAISEAHKDERRNALHLAALDEFFERGFAGARMEDIAKRAGVTKGTLYLYFSSKEDLFESLIESGVKPDVERIQMIAQVEASIFDVIRKLMQFAPPMIAQSNMPRLMKVLISESNTFPDVIRQHRERVIDVILLTLTSLFQKAKDRGEIEIGDPELTARLLIAPMAVSGIWKIVFAPTAPKPVDLEALFEHHTELFIRAITPAKSGTA